MRIVLYYAAYEISELYFDQWDFGPSGHTAQAEPSGPIMSHYGLSIAMEVMITMFRSAGMRRHNTVTKHSGLGLWLIAKL